VNWAATCAVVIPCRNEESSIADLVQAIRRHLPMVIVVDDGSTDQTAARAAAVGAQIVRQMPNRGKGAALKTGVAAARARNYQWVMTMDGDGQHRSEDALALLHCAEESKAALIIGNRLPNAPAMPWLRRMVNRWMSRRLSARAGQELPDSQCGFRLISVRAWTALSLDTNHFEIESEVLLAAIQAGFPVAFVPIQVVPSSRRSHIRPLRDAWRWWRWWRRSKAR
jgi:glycosyltransferase involved in cell wall biosynthesis